MRAHPLLLLGLALTAPFAAQATPDFPAAIARDLQLSAPPPCTICHATNEGGAGTVVKPFGKYMVSRGLVPFDESSLAGALAAAEGEHHDSDGDGISDIDALRRGLDPNGSSSRAPRVEDPQFGCEASGRAGGAWAVLVAIAWLLLPTQAGRRRRSEIRMLALFFSIGAPGRVMAARFPEHLRDTGLFADETLTGVAPGLLAYAPQYPLWSDGAAKRRWIRLPRGTSIDGRDPDDWVFPVGTRVWKEFSGGRRRETRLILRTTSGWLYATYRWNAEGTDAVLVPPCAVSPRSSRPPGATWCATSESLPPTRDGDATSCLPHPRLSRPPHLGRPSAACSTGPGRLPRPASRGRSS
jgi:hypothetical protein